jgi:hypothetical protein
MSDMMLMGSFFLIVFAPCLVVLLASSFSNSSSSGEVYLEKSQMPRRRGAGPVPLQAIFPEAPIAEDFEIRSFPKGLAQRRIVVRDAQSGIKLTIAQVRAAAELVKLGGAAAAYEFALVVAASAAAMTSVKNAVAIAAWETLEAARSAYAWFAWGDTLTQENTAPNFFEDYLIPETPPRILARSTAGERWSEATQAA